MTEPVIGCALVTVFQHFVGFVDFLEAYLAGGIARILVRMPFHRELSECRFEFGFVRVPLDFKGFVVATLHPSNPPEVLPHPESNASLKDAASGLTKNDPHPSRRWSRTLRNEGHDITAV
jgi:hypothetical protein